VADGPGVEWRAEIESVAFRPDGHRGVCVVHRRAFETLLGRAASPEDCAEYLQAHQAIFEQAAAAKIARAALQSHDNFHLTSRDIARQLSESNSSSHVSPTVEGPTGCDVHLP
jgi:hypothetical protein